MLVKVSLKKLLSYGALIDKATYSNLLDLMIDGKKYVDIPAEALQELQRRKDIQKEEQRKLNKTVMLNNKGIEYEKQGNVKRAISCYEKNISIGYPAHHSYKRLMVLYRKAKDYVNEERVILRALEIFKDYPEYAERLIKLHKIMGI